MLAGFYLLYKVILIEFNQVTMDKGAYFSESRKYRYALWRIWDKNEPLIMFIGLNPSTADENDDDRTINRVKNFASDWGYGGFYMVNIFAYITPYRNELQECVDPVGENDGWLERISDKCEKIVFAWGSSKIARKRAKVISEKFDGYALEINQDGSPRHPLYVKSNTKLQPYR